MGWSRVDHAAVAVALLMLALVLLLLLCVLSVFFCRKRRSDWACESVLPPPPDLTLVPHPHDDSCCYNDAFEYMDETSPRQLEEERVARKTQLEAHEPPAEMSLKRLDRGAASALAVEQLMRDSHVFDGRLMHPPPTEIHIIAAKRDYL